MKKSYLLPALLICLLTVSVKSNAQGSAWIELTDNTPSSTSFFSNISTLTCDSANSLYTNVGTFCFGVQVAKYKNNTWNSTTVGGCDETYLSSLQKDSNGEVYALLYNPVPYYYVKGWLYGFKGDSVKLYDTAMTNVYTYNNLSTFTVTNSGNIYVVQNTGINYGVNKWNRSTNNWTFLKGDGNDTISTTSNITNLYSDKNENVIAAVQDGANQKFLKWNGTKWLELGVNSGYLNNTNLIENIIKDNAGNLYSYGKLAALSNQVFRAKWNETTSAWEQLSYTANNPFSDTCIKPNSITYDKFGNVYGISKCKNASNREYVAKWNGTAWQEVGNLVINGAINAITVDNYGVIYAGGSFTNTGGHYYVAKYEFVAPAKLSSFSVIKENDAVVCKWQTVSEINFSHFEIERSFDGKSFATIGAYVAKGIGDYAFTDLIKNLDLKNNTLYYRLKLVEKDGSSTYSEIKTVNITTTQSDLQVYPMPAKDFININCSGGKALLIVDYTGRTVLSKSFSNNNQLKVDITQLNKGLYVVQVITANGSVKTQRIIVE